MGQARRVVISAVLALLLSCVVAVVTPAPAQAANHGQLRVVTSPALPSQIVVNDIVRDTWGLDWLDLPPGPYTVRFTRVQGWNTPAEQVVEVVSGQTTTVTGVFTRRGVLKVDTSPAVPGTITVDGIPRNNWGMQTDIPAGTHRVCFGMAPGAENPPCQSVNVVAGEAPTVVTGTYRPSSLGVSQVAGAGHTCAILAAGTLRCWGDSGFGRLGYANTVKIGDNETPGSVGPVDLGPGRTAAAVAAGGAHTCAILDDGTVKCWGAGATGRLGYANTTTIGDNETPASVGPVSLGGPATAISAGIAHTCAILAGGTVRCWGDGTFGRLGYGNQNHIGDTETPASAGPVNLGDGRAAVAIAAGGWHTCAILDNGNVLCWGRNGDGRLGYNGTSNIGDDETPGSVPAPVFLGTGRTAVAISTSGDGSGAGHTCAVLDNGAVRCWGAGSSGRLGYGNQNNIGDTETPADVPPVNLGTGRTATDVSAGGLHTCAILDDGAVKCWGSGSDGRLGYGDTLTIGDDETPADVGVVDLGAGRTATALGGWGNYSCAILNDGTLRCWGRAGSPSDGTLGYPNYGNVGDDETPATMGPVPVTTPGPRGQLRVTTTPALPSQISINGTPADSWSIDWLSLPPGPYTVSFGEVPGWTKPAAEQVTIVDGQIRSLNGTFTQKGSLRVTTSPGVGAIISVDGERRNEWGMWTDLPPATYQVCFSAIITMTTPPCQPVTVNAGQLTTLVGRYNAHWYKADGNPNDSVGTNRALWHGTPAYGPGDGAGSDQAFVLNGSNHLTTTVGAVHGGNFAAQLTFRTAQTGPASLFEARPACGATPAFWGLRFSSTGHAFAEYGGGAAPLVTLIGTSPVNNDAWHTVMLQRSGTRVSLVVDDVVQAEATVNFQSVGVELGRIGRSACAGADGTASFNGSIDDVRLGQPGDFITPVSALCNSSFELPQLSPVSFAMAPPATIPCWAVSAGNVDVVRGGTSTIGAQHESQWLDMNGVQPGTVCQAFVTTAQTRYRVGFWMSMTPGVAPGQLTASVTGGPGLVARHTGPTSTTGHNWQFHTFAFTAGGSSSTLCFASNLPASGSGGSLLDNVVVGT